MKRVIFGFDIHIHLNFAVMGLMQVDADGYANDKHDEVF